MFSPWSKVLPPPANELLDIDVPKSISNDLLFVLHHIVSKHALKNQFTNETKSIEIHLSNIAFM